MIKTLRLLKIIMLLTSCSTTAFASHAFKFNELQSEIKVQRAKSGVPHIYAHSEHDAYYMMGYLEAKDRFFQMDCARRYYQGRLGEIVGEKALVSDRAIRQIGFPYYTSQSVKTLSKRSYDLLYAFSRGINEYLNNHPLPMQYKQLHLTKKMIPNWTIVDSLAITRGITSNVILALAPGFYKKQVVNFQDLLRTESYLKYIAAGKKHRFNGKSLWYNDIYRAAPNEPAVTVPNFFDKTNKNKHYSKKNVIPENLINQTVSVATKPVLENGSNLFIVAGKYTKSGYPIMANDSHLPLFSPPLWYLINITVDDPKTPIDAHLSVLMPGGFVYKSGFNQHIAWGSTTSHVDVSDLFTEKLALNKKGTPTKILYQGKYDPLKIIKQNYYYNAFNGRRLKKAKHHPLIDDTYLIPFLNQGPLYSIAGQQGYGVLSTVLINIDARDINGYLAIPRARTLADFKKAIQQLDISYYNFGYIDVKGNIAFIQSGEFPIRQDLSTSHLTDVPPFFVRNGQLGESNRWIPLKRNLKSQSLPYKIIPFDSNPHIINPEQGVIVNANNDTVGATLDNHPLGHKLSSVPGIYYLGYKAVPGERAALITKLLQEKIRNHQKITIGDMKSIQLNNQSLLAKQFVPYILAAYKKATTKKASAALKELGKDKKLKQAIGYLQRWNDSTPTGIKSGHNSSNENSINYSIAATLYYVWQGRFIKNTIEKTLLSNGLPAVNYDIGTGAILHLLRTFGKTHGVGASRLNFFNVKNIKNPSEAKDFLILKSMQEALKLLKSDAFSQAFDLSSNLHDYRWGKLHRIVFKNVIGNNIPTLGGYKNLTPKLPGLSRDGGIQTINSANFNGAAEKTSDFIFPAGASLRQIVSMQNNKIHALYCLAGGESENPNSPYFASMLQNWLSGKYFKILLNPNIS